MSRHRKGARYAPYQVQCRSQLQYIDINSQRSFNNWKDEYVKDSKHSRQEDLPSSQLPTVRSQILEHQKQIFAVIDTCSLIKNHQEFVNMVTDLRRSYRGLSSPLRFVIPIEVVEELDRCNRPSKRRKQQQQNDRENDCLHNPNVDKNQDHPPVADILARRDPPRSFMRIIEEELRIFQIILPDFDPGHTIALPTGNLRQGVEDNSILGSCRRAHLFIESVPHHPDTKLILITEDNLFKTKATSFGLPSFRWREFVAKYRNFGKKNCNETPTIPHKLPSSLVTPPVNDSTKLLTNSTPLLTLQQDQITELKPLPPFSGSQRNVLGTQPQEDVDIKPKIIECQSALGKILPTRENLMGQQLSDGANMRATSMRIKSRSKINAGLFSALLGTSSGCSSQDDIAIIKEVITVE